MTTIGSITSQAVSAGTTDQADLIGNYETFLTLLTTQLQNQDPMEPMDSSQFTEQLVQYSAVEQQIKSNEQLENLASMMTSSNALGVLNFVGTTVTINGSQGYLSDFGSTNFAFSTSEKGTANITIRNEAGEIVSYQPDVSISSGEQSYKWDGTDGSGNRMGKGTYSIQIDAKDEDGNALSITSDTTGVVENVDLTSSEPMLLVNGQKVPTSQIKYVGTSSTTTTTS
ncbi:flagellar hook assembly protein FlgD [Cohaesibacter celericrescens]|uniref:Basal-body rod modification protein FlgD n=1 Tax=Cohaesibacter celericrescens TaxID=2067669 RepID=A0A2N5XMA1_9HYPH|nr:flagellar hook capping FlgD N-terminal domain-containing protein [Cohaesibacter celericrescens]PLW75615.1 flagellar hook capping protein [Cohaesibacter celericrescens]